MLRRCRHLHHTSPMSTHLYRVHFTHVLWLLCKHTVSPWISDKTLCFFGWVNKTCMKHGSIISDQPSRSAFHQYFCIRCYMSYSPLNTALFKIQGLDVVTRLMRKGHQNTRHNLMDVTTQQTRKSACESHNTIGLCWLKYQRGIKVRHVPSPPPLPNQYLLSIFLSVFEPFAFVVWIYKGNFLMGIGVSVGIASSEHVLFHQVCVVSSKSNE